MRELDFIYNNYKYTIRAINLNGGEWTVKLFLDSEPIEGFFVSFSDEVYRDAKNNLPYEDFIEFSMKHIKEAFILSQAS